MLTFFRKHKRGFLGVFMVGICAVLMLPFGFEYFGGNSVITTAASVDGEEISARRFYNELNRTEAMYREQFGDQYESLSKIMNLPSQVLDNLVDRVLLSQFFNKAGFAVGTAQIEQFTVNLPVFKDGINRGIFESFLKSTGLSEARYEQQVKEELMQDSISTLFGLSAVTSDNELEDRYMFAHRTLSLKYAEIKTIEESSSVKVKEEELKSYYETNSSNFMSEKKVYPVILKFLPSDYESNVVVYEEDIKNMYERNIDKYSGSLEDARDTVEKDVKSSIAPEFAYHAAEQELAKLNTLSENEISSYLSDLGDKETPQLVTYEDGLDRSNVKNTDLSPSLISKILNLHQGAIEILRDGSTPVLVYISKIDQPMEKNFAQVKAQIESILLSQKKAKASVDRARTLLDEINSLDEKEKYAEFLKLSDKKSIKVDDIPAEKMNLLKIPFIQDPNESKNIILQIIENKVSTEPYQSMDGSVYILALEKIIDPEKPSEDELKSYLNSEISYQQENGIQTLLTKLKLSADVEINDEILKNN